MRQAVETHHDLEIAGPRRQIWRGTSVYDELASARRLAYEGQTIAAIEKAQDIWIEKNGHMRDVAFRVVTTSRTITTHAGPWDYVTGEIEWAEHGE